ncbi:hypothetical protein [Anaeromyxobacter terrae]|uniref:hypothetical protein n=1 Tax=Anaeromyxobacter terrae TaxID=2925406 RepID=UPI001F5A90A6|nr:hypothetical protein [Anaeromyxobacter sp. SG22]
MHDESPAPHARALLYGALATLGLTAAHHVYGGVRYGTPWRHHAAFLALGVGSTLVAAFVAYRRRPDSPLGRAAALAFAGIALVFPVLLIGGFEGLYNHVLKNALFLGGAPRDLLLAMFPPPKYELPNDAWFELSGVLQVVPAAFAALAALRFLRALRVGSGRGERHAYGAPQGLV